MTIHSPGDLAHISFFAKPGTFIEFVIEREGNKLVLPVKVGSRSFYNAQKQPKDTQKGGGATDGSHVSELSEVKSLDANLSVSP